MRELLSQVIANPLVNENVRDILRTTNLHKDADTNQLETALNEVFALACDDIGSYPELMYFLDKTLESSPLLKLHMRQMNNQVKEYHSVLI